MFLAAVMIVPIMLCVFMSKSCSETLLMFDSNVEESSSWKPSQLALLRLNLLSVAMAIVFGLTCICISMWSEAANMSPGVMCIAKCCAAKLQNIQSGVLLFMLSKNVLKFGPKNRRLFLMANEWNSLPSRSEYVCSKSLWWMLKSPIISVGIPKFRNFMSNCMSKRGSALIPWGLYSVCAWCEIVVSEYF